MGYPSQVSQSRSAFPPEEILKLKQSESILVYPHRYAKKYTLFHILVFFFMNKTITSASMTT